MSAQNPEAVVVACPGCGQLNSLDTRRPEPPNCSRCKTALAWITDAAEGDLFSQLAASVVTVLKFTAPWCGPCKQLEPELVKIAAELPGRVRVMRFDTDRNPAVTQAWNVTSVPVVFVVVGGPEPKVAQRFNGLNPASVIMPAVKHALSQLPAQSKGQN